jgi:hypothetical protein
LGEIIGILIVTAVVCSPLWTSLISVMIPRRIWVLDLLICGLQGAIACSLWWFFWGGGIGGEARLTPALQWFGLLAVTPLAVCVRKHVKAPRTNARGFTVITRNLY